MPNKEGQMHLEDTSHPAAHHSSIQKGSLSTCGELGDALEEFPALRKLAV